MTLNNLIFKKTNILGKLSLNDIPFKDPILLTTFIVIILFLASIIIFITYFNLWKIIWNKWICSTDHKKIGIMYIILGIIMLIRGFSDALMMRIQQAISFGNSYGFLPPGHYDQIFTAHGVIMIFFVAMPLVTGLMNFIIPLQIGSRDVAFPFLNNLSFWMNASGAILMMISLFIGEFAKTGWMAYPPLSGITNSPSVGVDYYIWSLQISGIGTLLSGINLIVTIIKNRAPNMNLMKMPIFIWTSLCTNILIVISFPVLTTVLGMLSIDRLIGSNFFTSNFGGNPMMYINLIWIWGHPEVYILILPAFGIFSEITATFCGKSLFGYKSMVYATISITVLSYIVWLHHFFTMGAGADINAFFGITTMIISIPTGAKIFNWLFTMYKGKIRFEIPMLWTIGFMTTFVIGGMAGILLAIPPIDFTLHNSLFLVAHFHNVIIGGVVFGMFAGINYWFPKAFGYKLNNFWGICSFWFWIIGFYIAFIPLYILGLMGVTRRLSHFNDISIKIWFQIAAFGTILIALGIVSFIIQLIISYYYRNKLIDITGDPWNGRTLEWSTSSPPPKYNFAFIPNIKKKDTWMYFKKKYRNNNKQKKILYKKFLPINMPKNTFWGLVISIVSLFIGFSIIWHMWLLLIISFISNIIFIILYTFNYNDHYILTSKKISNIELIKKKNNINNNKIINKSHKIKKQYYPKDGTFLGFWIYIMSDCIIFACLFISYAVLRNNYINSLTKINFINLKLVITNTLILLTSSITYGISLLNCKKINKKKTIYWLITTIVLGCVFILIELYEISNLIKKGAIPQKSAFFTSFFTIIITHGIHVLFGIIWMIVLIIQIIKYGLKVNQKRLTYLSIFWHFLDIIWINIFTFIYLIGIL